MSKKIWIIVIFVILIIAAGFYFLQYSKTAPAPASGGTQTNTPPPQVPSATPVIQTKNENVAIINFSFSPATLTINKGDTVIWTNQDSAPHHILGTGFESANLANGQVFSFIFNAVGTFDYICKIHPSMKGTVIVK